MEEEDDDDDDEDMFWTTLGVLTPVQYPGQCGCCRFLPQKVQLKGRCGTTECSASFTGHQDRAGVRRDLGDSSSDA